MSKLPSAEEITSGHRGRRRPLLEARVKAYGNELLEAAAEVAESLERKKPWEIVDAIRALKKDP